MSTPKTGDRVKVEYEGVVATTNRANGGTTLRIKREDEMYVAVNARFVTVIEPAYETEAMYVDASGVFWLRTYNKGWIFAATGMKYPDDGPPRPLRKLVPEA